MAMTVEDSTDYASHHDDAPTALTALSRDVSALTVNTNSQAHPTPGAQATASANAAGEIQPSQQGGNNNGHSHSHSVHYQNYSGAHGQVGASSHSHNQRSSVLHSQEARASYASFSSSTAKEGGREHHAAHKEERKARHAASSRSQKANRHPKTIAEVVGKEKGKSFSSKAIVENWQWG